jgi:hypothetical protein
MSAERGTQLELFAESRRHSCQAIHVFQPHIFPQHATKLALGLRLSKRKRSLSRNISSAIVYDADLDTISQSTEIALERT